jgi:hypothetical protein
VWFLVWFLVLCFVWFLVWWSWCGGSGPDGLWLLSWRGDPGAVLGVLLVVVPGSWCSFFLSLVLSLSLLVLFGLSPLFVWAGFVVVLVLSFFLSSFRGLVVWWFCGGLLLVIFLFDAVIVVVVCGFVSISFYDYSVIFCLACLCGVTRFRGFWCLCVVASGVVFGAI